MSFLLSVVAFPENQRLIDEPLIGPDHFLHRGLVVLQMPLQDHGHLQGDETGQDEAVGLKLGGIQHGKQTLIFLPEKTDALIFQQ